MLIRRNGSSKSDVSSPCGPRPPHQQPRQQLCGHFTSASSPQCQIFLSFNPMCCIPSGPQASIRHTNRATLRSASSVLTLAMRNPMCCVPCGPQATIGHTNCATLRSTSSVLTPGNQFPSFKSDVSSPCGPRPPHQQPWQQLCGHYTSASS